MIATHSLAHALRSQEDVRGFGAPSCLRLEFHGMTTPRPICATQTASFHGLYEAYIAPLAHNDLPESSR